MTQLTISPSNWNTSQTRSKKSKRSFKNSILAYSLICNRKKYTVNSFLKKKKTFSYFWCTQKDFFTMKKWRRYWQQFLPLKMQLMHSSLLSWQPKKVLWLKVSNNFRFKLFLNATEFSSLNFSISFNTQNILFLLGNTSFFSSLATNFSYSNAIYVTFIDNFEVSKMLFGRYSFIIWTYFYYFLYYFVR